MIKFIFAAWFRSFSDYQNMKPKYQKVSKYLGFASVAIGCMIMLPVMYYTRIFFEIPIEGGSIQGLRLQLLGWIVVCCIAVPFAIYFGTLIIYGTFALVMLLCGRLTVTEAQNLVFKGICPSTWLIKNT